MERPKSRGMAAKNYRITAKMRAKKGRFYRTKQKRELKKGVFIEQEKRQRQRQGTKTRLSHIVPVNTVVVFGVLAGQVAVEVVYFHPAIAVLAPLIGDVDSVGLLVICI